MYGHTVWLPYLIFLNYLSTQVDFILGREIEVGGVYKGVVTSVKEYGAFVEFNGGQQGLLHISELSHEPVCTEMLYYGSNYVVATISLKDTELLIFSCDEVSSSYILGAHASRKSKLMLWNQNYYRDMHLALHKYRECHYWYELYKIIDGV